MSTNAYRPPNPKPKPHDAPRPKKGPRKKEPAGTHVDCSGRLYTLESLLGSGGFGDVYKVSFNGMFFAMKTERFDEVPEHRRRLKVEYNVYSAIQSSKRPIDRGYIFPRMHEFGKTKTFSFMIMEIVGPSLFDIRRKLLNEQNPSPRSVAEIARQTLWSIEALHDLGWIHRDIKPHNYAIGLPPRESNIVMLDFGTARMYKEKNGKMRAPRPQPVWKGTPRYASPHGLNKQEQSCRDDLIIWCFMMLEFYYLRNMHWSYGSFTLEMIIAMKQKMMSDAVGMREKGLITCPARFCEIMVYVSTLTYSAAVDFKKIHGILDQIIKDEKINMSLPLDWVGKEIPKDKDKGKLPRKEEKAARMEANFSGKGSARDSSSKGSSVILRSTGREPNKKSGSRSPPLDPRKAKLAKERKQLEDEIRRIDIEMGECSDRHRKKEDKPMRYMKVRRRRDEEDEESESSEEESDSEYDRRHRKRRRKRRSRKRRNRYRTRDESDPDRRRRREDSDRDRYRRRKREEEDDKEDENVKDTQRDEGDKGSPDRVKDTPRKRERRRTSEDKKRTGAKTKDGSGKTEEKEKKKEKDAKRGSMEDVKDKKNEKTTDEKGKDKEKKNESKELVSPEKASPAKAEPVKTQETPTKDSDNKKK